MSVLGRLGKLEAPTRKRWAAAWEEHHRRVFEHLPDEALDALLDVEVSGADEAALERLTLSLYAELGLDAEAWEAWEMAAHDATPEPEAAPPPYHLMPERLPPPPGDPGEALQAAKRWEYPEGLEGLARAALLWTLATAEAHRARAR